MVKRFLGLMVASGVVLSCSLVFAANCVDCHKSMEKVAEKINASGVKSADELVDYLRNKSSKKVLHKYVKDEDIRRAFFDAKGPVGNDNVKKEGVSQAPRKKKVEGC
jgi:hypothetical protein